MNIDYLQNLFEEIGYEELMEVEGGRKYNHIASSSSSPWGNSGSGSHPGGC